MSTEEKQKRGWLFRERKENPTGPWSSWAVAQLGIPSLLAKAQDRPDEYEVEEIMPVAEHQAALAEKDAEIERLERGREYCKHEMQRARERHVAAETALDEEKRKVEVTERVIAGYAEREAEKDAEIERLRDEAQRWGRIAGSNNRLHRVTLDALKATEDRADRAETALAERDRWWRERWEEIAREFDADAQRHEERRDRDGRAGNVDSEAYNQGKGHAFVRAAKTVRDALASLDQGEGEAAQEERGETRDPWRLGYDLAKEALRDGRRVRARLSLHRGTVEGTVMAVESHFALLDTGRVYWAELDHFEILPARTAPTQEREET